MWTPCLQGLTGCWRVRCSSHPHLHHDTHLLSHLSPHWTGGDTGSQQPGLEQAPSPLTLILSPQATVGGTCGLLRAEGHTVCLGGGRAGQVLCFLVNDNSREERGCHWVGGSTVTE